MAVHEFWFVSSTGERTEVRPMQAVQKCQWNEWRLRAEYSIEAGSVVVYEYEKVPA